MKNEVNRALWAKKKVFLTLILGTMVTLTLSAQGGITEIGATSPNSEATTTYDNPGGPNGAPGPNRAAGDNWNANRGTDPLQGEEGSPVGAPWILLGFAAAYAGVRLVKRGRRGVEE